MRAQRIGCHELLRDLCREALVETTELVDLLQLGELMVGVLEDLAPLAGDVGPLGVTLRADRHELARGHRHRTGDERRDPRDRDLGLR